MNKMDKYEYELDWKKYEYVQTGTMNLIAELTLLNIKLLSEIGLYPKHEAPIEKVKKEISYIIEAINKGIKDFQEKTKTENKSIEPERENYTQAQTMEYCGYSIESLDSDLNTLKKIREKFYRYDINESIHFICHLTKTAKDLHSETWKNIASLTKIEKLTILHELNREDFFISFHIPDTSTEESIEGKIRRYMHTRKYNEAKEMIDRKPLINRKSVPILDSPAFKYTQIKQFSIDNKQNDAEYIERRANYCLAYINSELINSANLSLLEHLNRTHKHYTTLNKKIQKIQKEKNTIKLYGFLIETNTGYLMHKNIQLTCTKIAEKADISNYLKKLNLILQQNSKIKYREEKRKTHTRLTALIQTELINSLPGKIADPNSYRNPYPTSKNKIIQILLTEFLKLSKEKQAVKIKEYNPHIDPTNDADKKKIDFNISNSENTQLDRVLKLHTITRQELIHRLLFNAVYNLNLEKQSMAQGLLDDL